MLNPRFLILLIAFHFTLSLKKDTKLDKKQPFPKPKNCDKIKCPPIEQPICTKLVYKDAGNKVIYVVMINKCEMTYVKCHEGLEAEIVPMKNCDHKHLLKSKRRFKRQISYAHETLQGRQVSEGESKEPAMDELEAESEANPEETELIAAPYNEDIPQETLNNADSNEENVEAEVQTKDGFNLELLHNEELDESRDAILIIKNRDKPAPEKKPSRPGIKSDEVDLEQYDATCPTVCPSRDIMVCAKCQHGIYRTFLSVCHMRMFCCSHTDETLELMSRYPCVMSAPYLSDEKMQPRGRVQEPNDHDKVLRFLRCKEKTQESREADPRCKFQRVEDTRLLLEDHLDDSY